MRTRPLPRLLLDGSGITAFAGGLFERNALDARAARPRYNLVVADAGAAFVALAAANPERPPIDLRHAGTFGLAWPGGYRLVGPPEVDGRIATRAFAGEGPTPSPGTRARIDTFAFAPTPGGRGYDFAEIEVPGPRGSYPAWLVPGTADTWVIAVHGKGANRREALRALPAFAAAGLPMMSITYRNDHGAPPAPDGRYGYGTEWPDIEAAVACALERGARRIVFNGYSMGAAICLAFLRHSRLADRVTGLAFDSPMLDFRETVAFGARRVGIPSRFVPHLMESFRGRYGTDWEGLTYYDELLRFDGPIAMFHGASDSTIPVATSDRAAALLGQRATFVRSEATEHVRSWNVDPEGYEAALRRFAGQL